jgi:hypothetical protein
MAASYVKSLAWFPLIEPKFGNLKAIICCNLSGATLGFKLGAETYTASVQSSKAVFSLYSKRQDRTRPGILRYGNPDMKFLMLLEAL